MQLFIAMITVMGIWGALLVTVFQIMLSRVMNSLKEELTAKISGVGDISEECRKVEKDLMQLKADLPEKYVRREDFIRFDVGINDKLDKLRDLIDKKFPSPSGE
jgi:uncharacterized protein YlxW (UPF0749 family)